MKMHIFSCIFMKMRTFSCIFLHFKENVRIFRKMRAEIAKNKFSEIGLASSKGISSKDPVSFKYAWDLGDSVLQLLGD